MAFHLRALFPWTHFTPSPHHSASMVTAPSLILQLHLGNTFPWISLQLLHRAALHPVLGCWEVELRLGESGVRSPKAQPLNTGVKHSNTFLSLVKRKTKRSIHAIPSWASVYPYKLIFTSHPTLLFCSYVHIKKEGEEQNQFHLVPSI